MTDNPATPTIPSEIQEIETFDRRDIMTKLVAAAALAATGLVSGEAGADTKTAKLSGTDKVNRVEQVERKLQVLQGFCTQVHQAAHRVSRGDPGYPRAHHHTAQHGAGAQCRWWCGQVVDRVLELVTRLSAHTHPAN